MSAFLSKLADRVATDTRTWVVPLDVRLCESSDDQAELAKMVRAKMVRLRLTAQPVRLAVDLLEPLHLAKERSC